MIYLILGLVLFLGVHLVPTFIDLRARLAGRFGENAYKGLFTLVSFAGLAFIVYGKAHAPFISVWSPPGFMRWVAMALMLPAFILLLAAYVPGNGFRRALGHPMVLAVKLWALAHVLANGDLASLLLFGGFLVWAVYDFRSARARKPAKGGSMLEPSMGNMVTVAAGFLLYGLVIIFHGALFGRPLI